MMPLPVRLRKQAIADLKDIGDHIVGSGASRKTALQFIQRIKSKCLKIGEVPHGSISREDLGPGIRIAAFERSAVIAYRVHHDAVEIVNVFYGGRDFEAIMRL